MTCSGSVILVVTRTLFSYLTSAKDIFETFMTPRVILVIRCHCTDCNQDIFGQSTSSASVMTTNLVQYNVLNLDGSVHCTHYAVGNWAKIVMFSCMISVNMSRTSSSSIMNRITPGKIRM